jgi:hypothetical protein
MLALQFHDASMMGLSAEGQLVTAVTESVTDRVTRLRARMIAIGIPTAVGSGIFTTLTFAGAFGLARTERVWAPAFLLGGIATLAGLVSVAVAAKTAEAALPPPIEVTQGAARFPSAY